MSHDSGVNCVSDKYVMAERSRRRGQIIWSECSRSITKNLWEKKPCFLDHTRREKDLSLNHSHYHDLPGREWTAKIQCELFLRNKDANVATLDDICQALQCKTPHKNKIFSAGPALDGTHCALGKQCRGGQCVSILETNSWSEWEKDSCKSGCVTSENISKGVQIIPCACRRLTDSISTILSCQGPYYEMVLCDDSSLCTKERETIETYTTKKCTEFILKMENSGQIDITNKWSKTGGLQLSHNVEKPWRACTVHCKRLLHFRIYTYEAPRLEMFDVGMDPYFPDGTWCHNKDGQNYYCRQHYCLPENYSTAE